MKKSFADYVRSGRLQQNADDAVRDAAQTAQRLGLRKTATQITKIDEDRVHSAQKRELARSR